jgi:hypothetical protein
MPLEQVSKTFSTECILCRYCWRIHTCEIIVAPKIRDTTQTSKMFSMHVGFAEKSIHAKASYILVSAEGRCSFGILNSRPQKLKAYQPYFKPWLHEQPKSVRLCHPTKKDRGVPNTNRSDGKIEQILAVHVIEALLHIYLLLSWRK